MEVLTVAPEAKGLIFDVDGTLVNTMPTHYLAWKQLAEEQGFVFPETDFYEWAGIPTIKIATLLNERYGSQLIPEKITEEKESRFLELIVDVQPVEAVVEIAKSYHGKLPMICGTGNFKAVAKQMLDSIGITNLFEGIVAAEDVENYKPSPETFLKCAEIINIPPQFCQVFEDGDQGLQAARTGGMIPTDIRPFL